MTYTTSARPVIFDYNVDGAVLQRPDTLIDLGVIFDKELTFVPHVNNVVAKSFKTLGFIIRMSRDISNICTLKILYYAFVRSKLEYASLVWNPHYNTHIDALESVQRRFVKLLWFKSDGVYPEVGFPQQELFFFFFLFI